MDDRLLTLAQAADRLHVGRTTAYRLIRDGALTAVKVAGTTRVRESDLSAYIAGRPALRRHLPAFRKD
ncbi:hypothetical protein GCM10017562_59810 [Streptomyces roseofulvus]|uniref:helix-turn-helix domain-containing protein n=1 Tax=Streptomyces roseofulvus TaxID=33902 RepID=UPI0031FBE5F5